MTTRISILLLLIGGTLVVGGTILLVALHGYTVFSLPITSTRDVVAGAAIVLFGLLLMLAGLGALLRSRRRP